MKTQYVIFLLVAVVVILAVVFWLRPVQLPTSTEQTQTAVQTSNAPVASVSVASQSTPVGINPTLITSPNLKSQPSGTNQTGLKEAIEKLVEGRNKPIRFYGQVIDQDSNGLAGVEIKSVVQQITMPDSLQGPEWIGSKYINVVRTTGADGRFEISGLNGDGFGIGLTKDGYEAEPDHRSFGQIGGSYDNPVIFKMWNTNIHEHLISGEKVFHIIPDGRPYFINLTEGTISESDAGDLKVWVKRPEQITYGQRYDWSCGIDAINGGLLEQPRGTVMYSAPTDEYNQAFQFEQTIGSGWGDSTGERQFYIRLNNGQEYGRISVELYAYYNDQTPGLIRLSYAINPSGSRILR